MPNLQVRNIPDSLHERLHRHARRSNCTITSIVLDAVEKELDRREWKDHLAQRPRTELGVEAAALLAGERSLRDGETS